MEETVKTKNELITEMVGDYQKGVVRNLSESEEPLAAIDLGSSRFGVTSIGIKGDQYLIFSALKEGIKGYPKGDDVVKNIVGIKINSIDEVNMLESWLEIMKANIVSRMALSQVVPADSVNVNVATDVNDKEVDDKAE